MQIKENDFIEIDYTGKLKDDNITFDTTSEETAKAAGIFNPKTQYKPMIVCVGHGQLLKGIDKEIVGKEIGTEYTFTIAPIDGFGKKNPELMQLIATPKFRKHGVNPVPGLQVNIDNMVGIIRTVTGGRTLVDFNHPCAGKDLIYTVKVKRIVTDTKEKANAFLKLSLGEQIIRNVDVKDKKVEVTTLMKMPEELQPKITEQLQKCIPEINEIHYLEAKEKSKDHKHDKNCTDCDE